MTSKLLYAAVSGIQNCRTFSTSTFVCGRKNLVYVKWLKRDPHPYDERFHISPREMQKTGKSPKGNNELAKQLSRSSMYAPNLPGYYVGQQFYYIPEMEPEFIVPDLKDFKLKPYVSYNVSEVTQKNFTAADLFHAVYAEDIVEKYQDGKIEPEKLTVDSILSKGKSKG